MQLLNTGNKIGSPQYCYNGVNKFIINICEGKRLIHVLI
ncbi:hypothetical protein SAMN05216518_101119 [Bacteroidales bacterium KHT7]|nr:hypothetical protein SAMN05216518_101119 [Bacteroidales bacterium KHT7]